MPRFLYGSPMRKLIRDPNIGNGEEIYEGTRILVRDIRRQLDAKIPPAQLLRSYPALDNSDIDTALKLDLSAKPKPAEPVKPVEDLPPAKPKTSKPKDE